MQESGASGNFWRNVKTFSMSIFPESSAHVKAISEGRQFNNICGDKKTSDFLPWERVLICVESVRVMANANEEEQGVGKF